MALVRVAVKPSGGPLPELGQAGVEALGLARFALVDHVADLPQQGLAVRRPGRCERRPHGAHVLLMVDGLLLQHARVAGAGPERSQRCS